MKSAIRSPNLEIWPLVRFWPLAVQDPSALHRSETCFGKPVQPPPQRQNDGSEREGGCRRSFGRHPENCFGKPDGPAPSARITERARATARVWHGCRGSFGRRRKVVSGSPTGQLPAPKLRKRARATRPSQKLQPSPTKFSREARRARPKPKPSMILRVTKNGTRRARAGFLRTLNPKVCGQGVGMPLSPRTPTTRGVEGALHLGNPKP